MLKLQGIFLPATTPFDYRGDLYKTKVRHNVEKWNMVKLSGYVVCGSTGEGVHLTTEEKVAMWGLVAECKAEERLLLAGVNCESVREAVALGKQAAALGYQAAVVGAPRYYGPLVDHELFFRAVADQAGIPVILAGAIPTESIVRLSEHPNIIAVEEPSGDPETIQRILRDARKGFQVLAGSAGSLWPSLDAGASGAVPAFANAAPYACITIWEAHRMREREAALDWQTRIAHPAELVGARYGIAGLKHAMDRNGFYGGPCRLPLRPLSVEAKAEIDQAFDGIRG